jgi:hypothetical protein
MKLSLVLASVIHIGFLGVAFAHIPKFSAKSKKCIFIGYSDFCKAYQLWDPKTHQIIESQNVIFDEGLVGDFDNAVNSDNSNTYQQLFLDFPVAPEMVEVQAMVIKVVEDQNAIATELQEQAASLVFYGECEFNPHNIQPEVPEQNVTIKIPVHERPHDSSTHAPELPHT